MKWILIWYVIYLTDGGAATAQTYFESEKACAVALEKLASTARGMTVVRGVCVTDR